MRLFPSLGVNWLNGWIFFVFYLIIFGITLSNCSKEVRERLYDRSLWDGKTKLITTLGKFFSLTNIALIFFARLLIGTLEFYIGTMIYLLGLSLLVISIINYRDAPLDEPITQGVYKYSRNPQMVSIFIMFAGMCLVIGSLINLVFLLISINCAHFSILGEEKALRRQYGESYVKYTQQVPRYFLFF
jgi:protein-S-isoprenylcysteine O-methyltransferase Ste14